MPTLVSVIIPSHNTGRFLPEALESVFAQSYSHYEIIVVDDGSTDETLVFLEPYRQRITYLYQSNQGVSAARNHALQVAQGEWVMFLDADDKVSPRKLERQLAKAGSETAILHSAWWLMDEQGNEISLVEPYLKIPKLDLETCLFWKPIFPAAMLFRRKWLSQVGGFDTNLHHAEDVDLVLRILAHGGEAVWLEEATAYYRQRLGSASTKTLKQSQSIEYVLDKLFALPHLSKRIRSIEKNVRYYSLLWHTWQLLDEDYIAEARENLMQAQTLTKRSACYLLLEWYNSYQGDATELFGECLSITDAREILTGDYRKYSPARQIDLVFEYIANYKSIPDDLGTQELAPAGILSAYLSRVAKAIRRKNWEELRLNLPLLLHWTFILSAARVYGRILRRIINEI